MSSKINRLRAERGKNDEKIAVLRARNNEIDKQITELENLDIVGIVRSMGMTPEQLAALIQASKTDASARDACHPGFFYVCTGGWHGPGGGGEHSHHWRH